MLADALNPPGGATLYAFQNQFIPTGNSLLSGSVTIDYTYEYENQVILSWTPSTSQTGNYEWYYDNVLYTTGSISGGSPWGIASGKSEITWTDVKLRITIS
jgi:hypothetical protein